MAVALGGIVPILVTPFDERGDLDEDSLRRELDVVLEGHADGVGTGLASETFLLSDEERVRVNRIVAERVGGRIPFIASVGGDGIATAIMRASKAGEAGATACLLLPPTFIAPSQAELETYVGAIAEQGIPLLLQDAPALTHVSMSVSWLAKTISGIDTVAGVKIEQSPSLPKISAVRRAAPEAVIFGGGGGLLFPEEITRGADGCMPGPVGLPIFIETLRAVRNGETLEEFKHLAWLLRFLTPSLDVFIWGMKQLLAKTGIIQSPRMRLSTPGIDERSAAELRALTASIPSLTSAHKISASGRP